jgi:pimeloyl-ACP methyl ester carboxylesterase
MKIRILPPRKYIPPLLKRLPSAAANDLPSEEPITEVVNHLDLARQRKFATGGSGAHREAEIDEAAIALVELSVLVYRPLDEVGTSISRFPEAHLGLFGKKGSRDEDWNALRWQRLMNTWARNPPPSIRKQSPDSVDRARPQAMSPELVVPADDLLAPSRNNEHVHFNALNKPPTVADLIQTPTTLPSDGLSSNAAIERSTMQFKPNQPAHALAFMHGDAALITFRGTLGVADWGLDLCFAPTWRLPFRHWGFQRRWRMLRPQLEAWLEVQTQRLGRRPTLYLGGHSLGGAVASLAAVDLASSYDIARVVTIGSPRPGGMLFRRQYAGSKAAAAASGCRTLQEVTTRFVHGSDVITIVPPMPFYLHVGHEIKLTAKDRVPTEAYTAGVFEPTVTYQGGLMPDSPSSRSLTNGRASSSIPKFNWRYALMQCALYLATLVPAVWGIRILVSFAPMLSEALVRHSLHHQSERYLQYFPATEIRRMTNIST